MEHVVAPGCRFGPTRIGVQIGAEHGKALADFACDPLTQFGAHITFARQVPDRSARFMPRRE
jgi:hypothetical protein